MYYIYYRSPVHTSCRLGQVYQNEIIYIHCYIIQYVLVPSKNCYRELLERIVREIRSTYTRRSCVHTNCHQVQVYFDIVL